MDSFDFSRYLGRDDLFAIREKESGRLIGIFVECDVDNVKKSLEIGYGFGSRYWGKGYATEAVKAMIAYYFTKSGMKTVYASFFPENVSSKHVMEKCGMTFSHINEKELTYLDKERDLVYFKIESGIEQSRKAFLNSFDFIRLGQAISSNNTQIAVMAAKGLEAYYSLVMVFTVNVPKRKLIHKEYVR